MTDSIDNKPTNAMRRLFLGRAALVVAGGAAVALAASSPAAAKAKQTAVKYQTTPKGKSACANCAQFIAPKACKVVDGDIAPTGWCLMYAPKV